MLTPADQPRPSDGSIGSAAPAESSPSKEPQSDRPSLRRTAPKAGRPRKAVDSFWFMHRGKPQRESLNALTKCALCRGLGYGMPTSLCESTVLPRSHADQQLRSVLERSLAEEKLMQRSLDERRELDGLGPGKVHSEAGPCRFHPRSEPKRSQPCNHCQVTRSRSLQPRCACFAHRAA